MNGNFLLNSYKLVFHQFSLNQFRFVWFHFTNWLLIFFKTNLLSKARPFIQYNSNFEKTYLKRLNLISLIKKVLISNIFPSFTDFYRSTDEFAWSLYSFVVQQIYIFMFHYRNYGRFVACLPGRLTNSESSLDERLFSGQQNHQRVYHIKHSFTLK